MTPLTVKNLEKQPAPFLMVQGPHNPNITFLGEKL